MSRSVNITSWNTMIKPSDGVKSFLSLIPYCLDVVLQEKVDHPRGS